MLACPPARLPSAGDSVTAPLLDLDLESGAASSSRGGAGADDVETAVRLRAQQQAEVGRGGIREWRCRRTASCIGLFILFIAHRDRLCIQVMHTFISYLGTYTEYSSMPIVHVHMNE